MANLRSEKAKKKKKKRDDSANCNIRSQGDYLLNIKM